MDYNKVQAYNQCRANNFGPFTMGYDPCAALFNSMTEMEQCYATQPNNGVVSASTICGSKDDGGLFGLNFSPLMLCGLAAVGLLWYNMKR